MRNINTTPTQPPPSRGKVRKGEEQIYKGGFKWILSVLLIWVEV